MRYDRGIEKYDLRRSAHARVRHASRGSPVQSVTIEIDGRAPNNARCATVHVVCARELRLPMTVMRELDGARARLNNGKQCTGARTTEASEEPCESEFEENENIITHTSED